MENLTPQERERLANMSVSELIMRSAHATEQMLATEGADLHNIANCNLAFMSRILEWIIAGNRNANISLAEIEAIYAGALDG